MVHPAAASDGIPGLHRGLHCWFALTISGRRLQDKTSLFCVVQTLALEGKKVPFGVGKDGQVVSVYNYAVNGSTAGAPVNPSSCRSPVVALAFSKTKPCNRSTSAS